MSEELPHSGLVAIAGRPNMGKSTFLNRVLGRKVSIVTPKPQTTRRRVMGALHRPGAQIVFLDTPGIHNPKGALLNKAMVKTAYQACRDVDLILYFVEAAAGVKEEDWEILRRLRQGQEEVPLILALNKCDLATPPQLIANLAKGGEESEQRGIPIRDFFPLSSTKGENIERLLAVIEEQMPPGPAYFPEGETTDQPEELLVAEIVREKLFMLLDREVPYAITTRTESMEEDEFGSLNLHVQILVSRASHKAIVIGKGGSRLKETGIAARVELERLLGTKIFLQLWVKVVDSWTNDPRMLRRLGYQEEDHGSP
ncbi:MAG: GTPase Era [Magnetococcales bacterium]|nr:GTPase Era [Magnetococcales bacterium]